MPSMWSVTVVSDTYRAIGRGRNGLPVFSTAVVSLRPGQTRVRGCADESAFCGAVSAYPDGECNGGESLYVCDWVEKISQSAIDGAACPHHHAHSTRD